MIIEQLTSRVTRHKWEAIHGKAVFAAILDHTPISLPLTDFHMPPIHAKKKKWASIQYLQY